MAKVFTSNGTEIRVLSLIGAYPLLLASGEKQIELRTWTTNFRGYVAFHCSKSSADDESYEYFDVDENDCPKSAIIGVGKLVEVIKFDKDSWFLHQDVHLRDDSYCEVMEETRGKPMYGHRFEQCWIFELPVLDVSGSRNYWSPRTENQEEAMYWVKEYIDLFVAEGLMN